MRTGKNEYRKLESNESGHENIIGQTLVLAVPESDEQLTLEVLRVDRHIKGEDIVTYSGKVADDFYSSFTISVNPDYAMGRVKHKGMIYLIEPNQSLDGQMTVSTLFEKGLPKDIEENYEELVEKSDNYNKQNLSQIAQSANKSGGSNGYIKVLFFYGSNVYGASTKVANFITDFNTALSNSQVASNNSISSAGVEMINDNFTNICKSTIVSDMASQNPPFSNIDQRLIATGADIGFLIVNGPAGKNCSAYPQYTGIVGGQVFAFFNSADPYGLVADNYLRASADFTGIHELGHILDGRHPNSSTIPSRGIIDISDQSKKWQSIMGSYGGVNNTQCLFTGSVDSVCERIHYFSNPALSYNGNPLGSSTRDMESSLESKMPIASNWRGAPNPPPSAPTGVSAISDSCYGIYNITWNSSTSATSYELYRSYDLSFSNPVNIYTGTSTMSWVNVPSGTWYFRVKACNAGGCSGFSAQTSATKLAYCM